MSDELSPFEQAMEDVRQEDQEEVIEQACKRAGHFFRTLRGRPQHAIVAYCVDEPLDAVAVQGQVMFEAPWRQHRAGYSSQVMTNPTWLDLCVFLNRVVLESGDLDHHFLEGVHRVRQHPTMPGVAVYEMRIGS